MNTVTAEIAAELARDRETDQYTANGTLSPVTEVPPTPEAEELTVALNNAYDQLRFDGFVSLSYFDGHIDVQVTTDYFFATYVFADTHVEEFPRLGCVRHSIKLQSGARILAIEPREFKWVAA